jgi:cytidylate kinase
LSINKTNSIAIDGPAGAGKSTVAKRVAASLKFAYVDSGAIYRTVALYFIEKYGGDAVKVMGDSELIKKELACFDIDFKIDVDLNFKVLLDSADVSSKIRTQQVSNFVPFAASNKDVREKVNLRLRAFAAENKVVMDGRDIASCVLPASRLKIFLTADAKIRAKRRYDELIAKNERAELDDILNEVIKRDAMDEKREIAPLVKTDDALLLDSSNLSAEEVVNYIVSLGVKEFCAGN